MYYCLRTMMHNNGQETTTQLPISVSGNEFMLITFVHRDRNAFSHVCVSRCDLTTDLLQQNTQKKQRVCLAKTTGPLKSRATGEAEASLLRGYNEPARH